MRPYHGSAIKWFRTRTRVDFKRDGGQIDGYGQGNLAEELRAYGRRDGRQIDGYEAGKI